MWVKDNKMISILLAFVIFVGSSFGLQQLAAPAAPGTAAAPGTSTAAELTPEDRAKIAYGNFQRVIKEVLK